MKVEFKVGNFRDRHDVLWCGSVLESRDGSAFRVHVPWLSADATFLREALANEDKEAVSRFRHSSYRMAF